MLRSPDDRRSHERLLADESLRRSAARCVLPAIRLGNEWRFGKRDLDACIERHRSGLPPPSS